MGRLATQVSPELVVTEVNDSRPPGVYVRLPNEQFTVTLHSVVTLRP